MSAPAETEYRQAWDSTLPPACGACGGRGGRVIDTSSDGVTRQSWQPCGSCSGSGVAR